MGHSEYDPAAKERRPWNVGRMVGAKRALKPQQVWAIRFWLDRERRLARPRDVRSRNRQQAAGCDVVRSGLVTLSAAAEFAHARSSSSRRQVGRFNSSSSNPPAAAFWPGSNAEAHRCRPAVASVAPTWRASSPAPSIAR